MHNCRYGPYTYTVQLYINKNMVHLQVPVPSALKKKRGLNVDIRNMFNELCRVTLGEELDASEELLGVDLSDILPYFDMALMHRVAEYNRKGLGDLAHCFGQASQSRVRSTLLLKTGAGR